MKLSIRRGIFETNSSSTHSLTICTKKEFEDFVAGKLVMVDQKLVEETEKNYDERTTYEMYCEIESWYDERFHKEYTTPSGEQVVAFGYAGEGR